MFFQWIRIFLSRVSLGITRSWNLWIMYYILTVRKNIPTILYFGHLEKYPYNKMSSWNPPQWFPFRREVVRCASRLAIAHSQSVVSRLPLAVDIGGSPLFFGGDDKVCWVSWVCWVSLHLLDLLGFFGFVRFVGFLWICWVSFGFVSWWRSNILFFNRHP